MIGCEFWKDRAGRVWAVKLVDGDITGACGPLAGPGSRSDGIDAISVNMDVIDRTRRLIDAAERRLLLDAARMSRAER